MKSGLWKFAALVMAVVACREELAAPGQCPELCPGQQIPVFDTAIVANVGSDTSFFGYVSKESRASLLISNGLPAAEARAFVGFPVVRIDSVPLDGGMQKFTPDTAAFSFQLQARDSTATGLKLYLYRLPLTIDSSATFPSLDAAINAAPILDSILVPDSLRAGKLEAFLTGEELALITTPPADSGKIVVGLRIAANKATGVRVALDPLNIAAIAPTFEFRGKIPVSDTGRQRQKVTVRATNPGKTGFIFDQFRAANPDPDLLYIGGPTAARAILRFSLPPRIKDTAQILRATIELTPAAPFLGLSGSVLTDSASIRGVIVDLGAKSPQLSPVVSPVLSGIMPLNTQDVVLIDALALILQWRATNGPPQVAQLLHNYENVSFMQPVFFSTRSASGQPRLRITYALPTGSNTP